MMLLHQFFQGVDSASIKIFLLTRSSSLSEKASRRSNVNNKSNNFSSDVEKWDQSHLKYLTECFEMVCGTLTRP